MSYDEYFLGQIIATSFNFVPQDFAACNGQLLNTNIYTGLFSLLGIRYGGDGIRTFAVPDLRGCTPVGAGVSVDAAWQPAAVDINTRGGAETVVLTKQNMPQHAHKLIGNSDISNIRAVANGVLGGSAGNKIYRNNSNAQVTLAASALAPAGSGAAHPNMQPFSVLSYYICINGLYPSRS